jgi:hypothetical protein
MHIVANINQDPSALSRSPKGAHNQRSTSLPINEFNRALRSHSVVLEDFPRISQGSTRNTNRESQQSQQTDVLKPTRPRGSTTPSRLWSQRIAGSDFTGLTPRPASVHQRRSNLDVGEVDTPIGTAISSGSHPNRRSRSLGSLRQAAGFSVLPRRRSDEINYWRQSHDPALLSPISSIKPGGEVEANPTILADESENKENEAPRDEEQQQDEEQPQPFNFGPLGELTGMRITQAASLEERVSRIEERVLVVEKSVFQWQRQQPIQFQEPPKRNSMRGSSLTRPQNEEDAALPRHRDTQPRQPLVETTPKRREQRSTSYSSFNLPQQDTTLLHPTTETLKEFSRPLSTTTTIRGISASPTSQKLQDISFTAEHYTALTNMVLSERARRIELESVVKSLQSQLQQILVTQRSRYPTPEAEPFQGHHSLHIINNDTSAPKDFNFDNEQDSSDDESQRTHQYEQEVYQTPMEERGNYGDLDSDEGIFGEVVNSEQRKAPRTLSLSQITMGKGIQQGAGF